MTKPVQFARASLVRFAAGAVARYLGWSGAEPAGVGVGVLPLSSNDPGARVTCGSRALVTADKGNDPPQNGRGLSQAWVRGPVRPLADPVST